MSPRHRGSRFGGPPRLATRDNLARFGHFHIEGVITSVARILGESCVMADSRSTGISVWGRIADYLFGRNSLSGIASLMLLVISG